MWSIEAFDVIFIRWIGLDRKNHFTKAILFFLGTLSCNESLVLLGTHFVFGFAIFDIFIRMQINFISMLEYNGRNVIKKMNGKLTFVT